MSYAAPTAPLPLCTYTLWLIALQPYSYQRDTTNLNFSHWLSALIHPVRPCKPTGRGWRMLLLRSLPWKKGPWKAWWWWEGLFGISRRLQENEWRKGKEATNSFVSRGFVCLPEQNVVLRVADIKACMCVGASSKASAFNYSLMDESIFEWIFVGSMSYSAAQLWRNILINNE